MHGYGAGGNAAQVFAAYVVNASRRIYFWGQDSFRQRFHPNASCRVYHLQILLVSCDRPFREGTRFVTDLFSGPATMHNTRGNAARFFAVLPGTASRIVHCWIRCKGNCCSILRGAPGQECMMHLHPDPLMPPALHPKLTSYRVKGGWRREQVHAPVNTFTG
jgi:hypothetical protein